LGKKSKVVNSDGESVITNEFKFGIQPYSNLFYLNETKYKIKRIDFKTKLINVQKRGFRKFEDVPLIQFITLDTLSGILIIFQ
tara:strand:+ start:71 stop:319 length:249 start_codon:yes stop_codon:yes gene_type:complete